MKEKLVLASVGFLLILVSSDVAALSTGASISPSITDGKPAAKIENAKNGLEFHTRIQALYSFKPAKLSGPEKDVKSSEMDKFWNLVKGEPGKYLPLLRSELKDTGNPSFFFYDGAKLLMSVSKDKEDQSLALEAISRTDLEDVDPLDYVGTVNWLAQNGFNTTRAAFRVLDYPQFRAIVPQHALTLGQNYCLIYMLFPCEESIYLDPLLERFGREKEPDAQKSLALALFYTVTPRGVEALKSLSYKADVSAAVKDYVKQLLGLKGTALIPLPAKRAVEIKEERRKVMSRISDEALIEFDDLTRKLLPR